MPASVPIVVFQLAQQRYGLALEQVERVLQAVAVTSLPDAPAVVLGVVNLRGSLVPVVDLRLRFGLARREVELSDHLLVAATRRRTLALLVEAVEGVVLADSDSLVPRAGLGISGELLSGVLKGPDGLTLIHDLETLLALDEEARLDAALSLAEQRA
jgi:purine-binding chemotaxis protein CheW